MAVQSCGRCLKLMLSLSDPRVVTVQSMHLRIKITELVRVVFPQGIQAIALEVSKVLLLMRHFVKD